MPSKILSSKLFKLFGHHLKNPLLWYINRHSICKAVFVGTFFGLLPIPFHSIFIVIAILIWVVNLPIGLTLAWLMNPLTIAPILYGASWIGCKIYHTAMLNQHDIIQNLHEIKEWLTHFGHTSINLSIAKILSTGLIIEALLCAILFSGLSLLCWDISLKWSYFKRKG